VASIDSSELRSYRDAAFPPDPTPWREAVFTVIDLELTGLDPASDEIIAFATVTVSGGKVRLDDARYELVRPKRMPDWDTIRIHGLREVDLEEAQPLEDLLGGLLDALTGRPIVAHVAEVERRFLDAALARHGTELRNPIVDTAGLDRALRYFRGQPPIEGRPVGLTEMARALGLPAHRPHHADGDALTTAQAFIALATHLDAFTHQTVGSLERPPHAAGRRTSTRSLLEKLGLRRRSPGHGR
jgi:DNA polymerase-3 subunit epsilon